MEAIGSFGWFLLMNILIIMVIAFIFYGVRSFFIKPNNDDNDDRDFRDTKENNNLKEIEQKLDRIIELLEKEKKD
ncbi:DUF4083 family protein [Bacillus sinesaloumensis]|uniref:DUF4083 family protein n=1 Tax=Litchfieldia sinesaloumensis TaxID=1926280 RepID=UPI0009887C96|nr:DUF4083 family protein [Bacillus sinesaloumensis]